MKLGKWLNWLLDRIGHVLCLIFDEKGTEHNMNSSIEQETR
jgi:hypothetical protein